MHYRTLLRPFKKHVSDIGYAPGTQGMLVRCTAEFLQFCRDRQTAYHDRETVLSFYEHLHLRPSKHGGRLSAMMIHHTMYSLRVFFGWLESTGRIGSNPMSALLFPAPGRNTRPPFSQGEMQKLFDAAVSDRETAVLNLVVVRSGKGARRRSVPVTDRVKEALQAYYNSRTPEADNRSDSPYMLNNYGARMQGYSYDDMLKLLAERAGLRKAISPHVLRHSIATHLLENGCGIEYVRDFLGHRHLETTQGYTSVSQWQIAKL
jgi:integrase/recombinase XerD